MLDFAQAAERKDLLSRSKYALNCAPQTQASSVALCLTLEIHESEQRVCAHSLRARDRCYKPRSPAAFLALRRIRIVPVTVFVPDSTIFAMNNYFATLVDCDVSSCLPRILLGSVVGRIAAVTVNFEPSEVWHEAFRLRPDQSHGPPPFGPPARRAGKLHQQSNFGFG